MADTENTQEAAEVVDAPAFLEVDPVAEAMADLVASGDVIKCKPWGEGQGDHVFVSAASFDPAFHVVFDAPEGDGEITADEITAALELLDGSEDKHWTSAGLPAVEAVAELAGKSVTRAAIEAIAPDLKRPAA